MQTANFLSDEVTSRLLERLEFIKISPKNILYISKTHDNNLLMHKYPEARQTRVTIDQLPQALEGTYDVIFSDWEFSCLPDFQAWIHYCFDSLLNPGGLLFFAILGLDTLRECHALAWEAPLNLWDMHNVGDVLLAAGGNDPVLDRERISLEYSSFQALVQDIPKLGFPEAQWSGQPEDYRGPKDVPSLTLEVIYAHVWAPLQPKFVQNAGGEVAIPIKVLQKKREAHSA
jgi:malonyl-CoA O-methyltransferase